MICDVFEKSQCEPGLNWNFLRQDLSRSSQRAQMRHSPGILKLSRVFSGDVFSLGMISGSLPCPSQRRSICTFWFTVLREYQGQGAELGAYVKTGGLPRKSLRVLNAKARHESPDLVTALVGCAACVRNPVLLGISLHFCQASFAALDFSYPTQQKLSDFIRIFYFQSSSLGLLICPHQPESGGGSAAVLHGTRTKTVLRRVLVTSLEKFASHKYNK